MQSYIKNFRSKSEIRDAMVTKNVSVRDLLELERFESTKRKGFMELSVETRNLKNPHLYE